MGVGASNAMAASRKMMLVVALVVALAFRESAFLPPPASSVRPVLPVSAAAGAAAALGSAPAFADEIGDAAAKLSKAAYPFMKEVDWNSNLYSVSPGSKDAVAWAKAIGKMIDMGAAMDTKLLKAGADGDQCCYWAHDSICARVEDHGCLQQR